jgi:serine/threonine protein kinase/Flp pilus assembly protein TadD
MLRGEEGALAEVAASVADGESVDWTAAHTRLAERERRLIPHLRLVQSIAQLHRTLPVEDDEESVEVSAVRRWGSLVLLDRLGEGTSGEVYRAWDARLHRDVALKLLHQGQRSRDDAQERVLEEARRLARIRHEHVVTVHGVEEHDGRGGLWMEFVRGESLEERIRTRGPLSSEDATRIGQQLCSALAAVHAAGLLHRDVKAQNVIQEPSGRIVLMDFGTGEKLRQAAGSSRMAGTPLYLAPEIFKGEPATIQSDVYSLGVLLFHLVTGDFPVKASSMPELGRAHSQGMRQRLSELRPDLPKAFVAVVDRALERDPGRRYRTADELELALECSSEAAIATRGREPERAVAAWRWPLAAAAALLLTVAVGLIVWTRFPAPAGGPKRLDVLPMKPIDSSSVPPFLAEGLTDQLISTLGQIQSLTVKFATASSGPGSSGRALPDIDAVLETTLLMAGGGPGSTPRVRVNARLLAAGNSTVMWARTFEHALGDTFALQAAMAREIATAVDAAVTPDERGRLGRTRQTTPEAEVAFLEGRAHIEVYGEDAAQRALDAFRRALDADPNHAAARAGAARSYFTLGAWGRLSQPVARALALAEAQKAMELDAMLPDAHATLAGISWFYDWNWQSAEAGYARSLNLNPSYRYGRLMYSQLLAAAGRTSEAIAQAALAVELDPASAQAHRYHGLALYYDRGFDAAESAIRKSMEFEPNAPSAWILLGRIAEARGDLAAAREHTNRGAGLMSDMPGPVRVQQLRLEALSDRRAAALAELTRLRQASEAAGILWDPVLDAHVQLASGDYDQALSSLERALEQRQPSLLWVAADPRMDPVRDHPRFVNILRTLGITPKQGS